jgi:hypothetical protein
MLRVALAFFLCVYGTAILIGGSILSSKVFRTLFPKKDHDTLTECILGFALLPVFVTYGAFLHIWQIPMLPEIAGAICVIVAVWEVIPWYQSLRHHRWHPNLRIAVLPAIAFLSILIGKYCNLLGGQNNGDDVRSIALTGAFATNFLKPAFPFDFSVPISYSYYLYESSAFLYATFGGLLFPSLPVLLVNLGVVLALYAALYRVARTFFPYQGQTGYIIASLFLTFYGFDGFRPEPYTQGHIEWWNWLQVTQMSSIMHWVYQYLFSTVLVGLGIATFASALAHKQREALYTAALLCLLAFGYGTFPAVWAAPAILLGAAWFLALHRWNAVTFFLRCFPSITGLSLFAFLPQAFTFVSRDTLFSLGSPRTWFGGIPAPLPLQVLHQSKMLFMEFGPFLLLGMVVGMLALRRARPQTEQQWLRFIAAAVIAVMVFLMTFSHAPVFDWFARGMMPGMFFAAFFAAATCLPLLKQWRIATCALLFILLLPQAYTFFLEHYFRTRTCGFPSEATLKVHRDFPFGTVIHTDGALFQEIIHAGRAVLTKNYQILDAYLNDRSFLRDTVAWSEPFTPCTKTLYGRSTPSGWYVEHTSEKDTWALCP